MGVLALGVVKIHADGADVGVELLHLFLHPLGAHAYGFQVPAAALGAGGGHVLPGTAVVAVQLSVRLVPGVGNVAGFALQGMAALAAHHRGRIPPAVDKQHGLLAAFDAPVQALQQLIREHTLVSQPQLFPHVHDRHLGQRAVVDAAQHLQQHIIALLRLGKGQDAGGGAGQQQGSALAPGAAFCHLPGVIAGGMLGKIALLVLFIHDEDSGALHRGKYGRSGTNNHPGLSHADAPPLVVLFASRQAGMQHRCHIAKAPPEPGDNLGCQHDFRHQHHGAFAHLQALPDRLDVHLRLAAACNAMEQETALTLLKGRQYFAENLLLARR